MYLYTKKKTYYPDGKNKSPSEPKETISHRKEIDFRFSCQRIDLMRSSLWLQQHLRILTLFTLCTVDKNIHGPYLWKGYEQFKVYQGRASVMAILLS